MSVYYWLTFASFATALILMLLIGSPMIRALKRLKGAKWAPREDTPDSHLQKAGVPSMGGIGIIGTSLAAWLLIAIVVFFHLSKTQFVFPSIILVSIFPLIVLGHALLGYIDDLSKARSRGGITSKQKLAGQTFLALSFLVIQVLFIRWSSPDAHISEVSFFGVWWMWPIMLAIVIGTSNAVNLTDGIDGLAAGLSIQVALSFLLVSLGQINDLVGMDVAIYWMCLGGACLGFLAFNKNPAKVFMGDTGSLALGAALGVGAILTKTVFLLPFIGFIFFVEMFSVIAQVAYFKYTKKKFGEGKRIFRRAPLHHHFELGGWREWRVVGTFWAVNAVTSILGLALWKAGVLPKFPW